MEQKHNSVRVISNGTQFIIGVALMGLGSLIYLCDRPPEQTYFIHLFNNTISFFNVVPNLFGTIGYNLPAFFHISSLILITASLSKQSKRRYIAICLVWLSIEAVFELGQAFSTAASRMTPDILNDIPFFENTKNFFLKGTFDLFDLSATVTGSLLGYIALLATKKKKRTFEKF